MTKLWNVVAAVSVLFALTSMPSTASTPNTSTPNTTTPNTTTSTVTRFPDAPHADALIEWWYANAHVTTHDKRHLAIVAAFFKFGNPMGDASIPPSHYLIYAITDLDAKTQRAYSYADSAMVRNLKKLLLAAGGDDSRSMWLLHALLHDTVPYPHQRMTGPVGIASDPLYVHYGDDGSLKKLPGVENGYRLTLGKGADRVAIDLVSTKPVMPVGGNGETGLAKPTDMYYYSLTRCTVAGSIGYSDIDTGQGWIDHQWGSSWTTQSTGWDWFGIQLADGTDVNVFEQRDLKTGKTFFPLATIMGTDGKPAVIRDVEFKPDPRSLWRSPRTGVLYPLAWTITLPEIHFDFRVVADLNEQEIPILTPSGDIWEGSCTVHASGRAPLGSPATGLDGMRIGYSVDGVAYMELVGYGRSPADAKSTPARKAHR